MESITVQKCADKVQQPVLTDLIELEESQLAAIGGGIGEVVLG